MARVSPLLSAFNGGEWSPLMEGRVTHERYKAAMRRSENLAGLSQGPAIRRSGTGFVAPQFDHTAPGRMIDFEFSVLDTWMLGFEHNRVRFLKPDGVLLEGAKVVTALVGSTASTITLTVPGHGYAVNDEVFFVDFLVTTRLFQAFGVVSAVNSNDVTISGVNPAGYSFAGGSSLQRVFRVTTPYNATKVRALRSVQSADTLFLFEGTTRSQVLLRNSTLDWPIRDFQFSDGPYLPVNTTTTKLTPTTTGSAITSFNAANAFSSGDTVGGEDENAFDGNLNTGWVANTNQVASVGYNFGSATPLRGYTIYGRKASTDNAHPKSDYYPGSWRFEGSNDGTNWTTLDTQLDYVLYKGTRSVFFKLKTEPNNSRYRIFVDGCRGGGTVPPIIDELLMTPAQSQGSSSITFNASSTAGINRGAGFLSTDVGRPMRFRSTDGFWRWYTITAVNSTTQIVCRQESDALPDLAGTTEWRLGVFSGTTGWPTCGYFYEDRLIVGGGAQNPDLVAASATGDYEAFPPSDPDGVVADNHSWVAVLNGRKVGAVTWIEGDSRGLIVGTINGPWAIRSTDSQKPLTPLTAKAKPLPRRACANVEPVAVDNQLLFLPRSQRVLRELAYDFNVDAYQALSMSLFASHFGSSRFQKIVYAAEPHSIIWSYREDGLLAGFTYNRDEQVFGWHRHPMMNGTIVDIGVLSGSEGAVDELWALVRRTIEGQTRYYYEILKPFVDFTTTLDNCWFVDCGFEYQGAPVTVVQGLWRLEGQLVSILADGVPITPQTVTNGTITLPFLASRVLVGIGYDAYGESMRPEAGAADGTAQGDTVRAHKAKVRLWNTLGGSIGPVGGLQELDYRTPEQEPGSRLELFTGDFGPIDFPDGYNDGVIAFSQPGSNPLPFNVVAIMPKQVVQEGG